jgi:hypothetical protein
MTDRRQWVNAHKVCWELEPLRELVEGHGVQQTGYELRLFGWLDHLPAEQAEQAMLRVHGELREFALDVLASCPEPHALLHVRPFDRTVHMRPENAFAPEIELAVVAYPRHPVEPMAAAEAQGRIAAVEERLRALGCSRAPRVTLSEFASAHAGRSRA